MSSDWVLILSSVIAACMSATSMIGVINSVIKKKKNQKELDKLLKGIKEKLLEESRTNYEIKEAYKHEESESARQEKIKEEVEKLIKSEKMHKEIIQLIQKYEGDSAKENEKRA